MHLSYPLSKYCLHVMNWRKNFRFPMSEIGGVDVSGSSRIRTATKMSATEERSSVSVFVLISTGSNQPILSAWSWAVKDWHKKCKNAVIVIQTCACGLSGKIMSREALLTLTAAGRRSSRHWVLEVGRSKMKKMTPLTSKASSRLVIWMQRPCNLVGIIGSIKESRSRRRACANARGTLASLLASWRGQGNSSPVSRHWRHEEWVSLILNEWSWITYFTNHCDHLFIRKLYKKILLRFIVAHESVY